LILHDDGHAVTADKLDKLVKAAGVEVAPYWGMLFERVLKERNLDDLILNGGGAPAAGMYLLNIVRWFLREEDI